MKTIINKLTLITGLLVSSCSLINGAAPAATKSLSNYAFQGAAVLPVTTIKKFDPQTKITQETKYFILGREKHKKTWNAFGGDKDKGENHPEVTAGREFYEETAGVLFDSATDAIKYINIDKGHTESIIANRGGVNYVTTISKDMSKKFIKEFYPARKKTKSRNMREMDKIALVREDRLQKAIANKQNTVEADVINEDGTKSRTTITLRKFFAKLMQPYFANQQGTPGKDPRIVFYD
ncbi:MAG: hypothetical protein P4L31_07075 [Candidatus Babeliales bacterium]|nr:hypothetical protein [Candidatus Babeliales bacterium]